jgi:hypothetical protein
MPVLKRDKFKLGHYQQPDAMLARLAPQGDSALLRFAHSASLRMTGLGERLSTSVTGVAGIIFSFDLASKPPDASLRMRLN